MYKQVDAFSGHLWPLEVQPCSRSAQRPCPVCHVTDGQSRRPWRIEQNQHTHTRCCINICLILLHFVYVCFPICRRYRSLRLSSQHTRTHIYTRLFRNMGMTHGHMTLVRTWGNQNGKNSSHSRPLRQTSIYMCKTQEMEVQLWNNR